MREDLHVRMRIFTSLRFSLFELGRHKLDTDWETKSIDGRYRTRPRG